jgi:hypothetical protein
LDFENLLNFDPDKLQNKVSGVPMLEKLANVSRDQYENFKRQVLINADETYESMPWMDFVNLINNCPLFPFKQILKSKIKMEENTDLRVWTYAEMGIMILASGKRGVLAKGEVYAQVDAEELDSPWSSNVLDKRGGEASDEKHIHAKVNEALIYWLIKLTISARMITPWRKGVSLFGEDENPWCFVPGLEMPMNMNIFNTIFKDSDDRRTFEALI